MFSSRSDAYVENAEQAEYEAAVRQHGAVFENEKEYLEALTEEVKEALQEAGRMYLAMQKDPIDQEALIEATRNAIKESAQVLAVVRKYRIANEPEYRHKVTINEVEFYR